MECLNGPKINCASYVYIQRDHLEYVDLDPDQLCPEGTYMHAWSCAQNLFFLSGGLHRGGRGGAAAPPT